MLGFELFGVLVFELHVETFPAISAAIRDPVAGLERIVIGAMSEPAADAAAFDAMDLVGDLHDAKPYGPDGKPEQRRQD